MANTDPLQSFLDYIADVKPYHTKVMETTMTYTYTEPVNTTVLDKIYFNIQIHTLGDTDPQGYVYGGGAHQICPGVGWDTEPWDLNQMWDYPYICALLDPRQAYVTITETFNVNVSLFYNEQVYTFAVDTSNGWDIPPWDITPWDYQLGIKTGSSDTADDAGQTTIQETFVLTWNDTDGSTGTVDAEA